ncbi:hypothetical protein GCM10027054_04980 [Isoptericola nanjingensis]
MAQPTVAVSSAEMTGGPPTVPACATGPAGPASSSDSTASADAAVARRRTGRRTRCQGERGSARGMKLVDLAVAGTVTSVGKRLPIPNQGGTRVSTTVPARRPQADRPLYTLDG